MTFGWKWGLILLAAIILAALFAGWTWDDTGTWVQLP